jgi:hypothetical protein
MAEIEPQPIRRVQTAPLCHMVAKRVAQRLMQQMGRRMICADLRTAGMGNFQFRRLPLQDRPFQNLRHMDEDALRLRVSVTSARPVSVRIYPASPTCPPDSA